jgi:hypothetical protein
MDKNLKERLSAMPDETLLSIMENKPDDYTAGAIALVEEEIFARGGLEVLKRKVRQFRSESPESRHPETQPPELHAESNELLDRLKKFYLVLVFVAYVLFLYVIRGSLWFYWFCVFGLIAFFIRVLIRARRLTPEEEYEEIAKEIAKHPDSAAKGEQQADGQE